MPNWANRLTSAPLLPSILALTIGFGAVHRLTLDYFFRNVPESLYANSLLWPGLLTQPPLAAMLVLSLLPIAFASKLRWRELEAGPSLRWVALGAVFGLAWAHTTYGFDYYYGTWHGVDRLLLAGLAGGACFSAAFLPAFGFQLMLLLAQATHPLGALRLPIVELRLPLDVLIVFIAFVLLRSFALATRRRLLPDGRAALVVSLCAIGGSYFLSGLEKLQISPNFHEWFLHNDLSLLLLEATRRGWLMGFAPQTIEALREILSQVSPPVLLTSLLIELSCLFIATRRWLAIVLILACAAFHLGVALVSGYLFLKWVIVDLTVAMALHRLGPADLRAIFSRPVALATVLLVPLTFFVSRPIHLGWFERSYTYHFRFELISETGEVYTTMPSLFGPHAIIFSYDRFNYLLDRKTLQSQKSFEAKEELLREGPAGAAAVVERFGRNRYKPAVIDRLDEFLLSFFRNRNASLGRADWLASFQPPPFQVRWVERGPKPYPGDVPIAAVRVRYIEEHFDNGRVATLENAVVHEVEISGRVLADPRPAVPSQAR